MIYYFTFIISSLFIYIASLFEKKNKFLMSFFVAVSIIILALLAFLRDTSIGTDTLNYNNYYYYVQSSKNLIIYCKSMHDLFGIEYGFSFLNYIIGILNISVHSFYFICECIIGINVSLSIFSLSKKINVTLGWMTYCCIFYTLSFNILRQSLALSIILLAITQLYKNKLLNSVILAILAIMFHGVSVIIFMIIIFGILLMRTKTKSQYILVISIMIIISILLPVLIKNPAVVPLLGSKYSQYLGQQYAGQQTIQSINTTLIIRLPMIILAIYSLIANKNSITKNDAYIYYLIIVEACILPFQLISPAMGRIVLYFGVSKIIGYPLILNNLGFKNSTSFVIKIMFICFLLILFYYQVIVNNNNMVYPYVVSNDF